MFCNVFKSRRGSSHFQNKKGLGIFGVRVWSEPPKSHLREKRGFQMFLQSPLSGERKCKHVPSPKKMNIWGRAPVDSRYHVAFRAQRRSARAPWGLPTLDYLSILGLPCVYPGSTLGLPWVYLGSTLDLPRICLGSTYGNIPSHLGLFFAGFR